MAKTYLPVKIDKGNGTPTVLIHGLGNNHKSWSFVVENLDTSKHRIIVPDLLGFGDAPKPKNCEYTPKDHADAVIKTLDQLSIRNALIVGHSMGCIIAIEIAKQRPDLVRHLALFGAPIYDRMPTAKRWSLRPENGYFAAFSLVKKNPDLVQAGGTVADELVPFVKGMEITEETWPAYKKSLSNTIMQFQTFKDAQRLRVPTLYINGILDLLIIRKNIKKIAKQNKQYVKVKTTLGPHEITPLLGKKIAKILERL